MQIFKLSVCGLVLAVTCSVATRSFSQALSTAMKPVPTAQDPVVAAPATPPVKQGKKEKPVKLTPLAIVHGVLTVDGWTAKADLNYAIADMKFLYVWVPGTGTFVISNKEFPGSAEMKDGFDGTMLTVSADKHKVQVVSDRQLLQKKKESAFVSLDRGYKDSARAPQLGYGDKPVGPYTYPGALVSTSSTQTGQMPAEIRPVVATKTACAPLSHGTQGNCEVETVPKHATTTKSAPATTLTVVAPRTN